MSLLRSTRPLSLVITVALVAAIAALVCLPLAKTRAAATAPRVTLRGASRPFVDAGSARNLKLTYAGKAETVAALQAGARPTALTSDDFDADGAPDLVAGYGTANGGVVTLTRGNPDAFAPKNPKLYQQALNGKVSTAFLTKAAAFAVPESPDFLATGDFDGDGHKDVLAGTRGGGLYLLRGDGRGKLLAAVKVALAGQVSALAVNGASQVAVGIEKGSLAEVLVFDPRSSHGFSQPTATHSLSATATSMEWGRLGINTSDLAVAAGNDMVVIYRALNSGAQSETVSLGFHVQAIALGDFIWDRDGRVEIAALGDDGAIHILQHGTLDTRPLTAADIPGRRAQGMAWLRKPPQDPTSLGAWAETKQLTNAASSTSGVAPQAILQVSHLAPATTHGLMVLDSTQKEIRVLNPSAGAQAMAISGTPVAAHALPAMLNGTRSLAVLSSSQTAPMLLDSLPDPTFNVTTTADEDDAGACTSSLTGGNGADGVLSLREAVCEANNNGAAISVINLPAGTYSLSLNTFGGNGSPAASAELQVGMVATADITINGAGAGSTIIQQTSGADRVIEQDPNVVGVNLTIENVTLSHGNCAGNTGLDCGFGGGAILGGSGPSAGNLTLSGVVLDHNTTGAVDAGGGVNFSADGTLTVSNSTFSNNTATQEVGGAINFEVNASSGNLVITNSTFTNNTSTAGSLPGEGGAVSAALPSGTSGSITGSTFTGNSATGSPAWGGAIISTGAMTVSNSRIVGNSATLGSGFLENGGAGNVGTVTNNWWGCNAGPNNAGCDHVDANPGSTANFNPWLELSISASPTQILPSATSTLTADLTHNSNNFGGFQVPDGTGIAFGGTLGTDSPTSTALSSGQATSTYTAGAAAGHGTGAATVDNQTVSTPIEILDSVTVGTNPTGLSFSVDTINYTAPQSFNWVVGSPHTIATSSPQAGATGSQYVFTSWSDAGAISHVVSAPTATTTYTANFKTQYQLTTAASPSADGSVTPASGSYFDPGASIAVTATPNGGFQFTNWTSTGGTFDSTTAASTNFHMPSAATSVTGNFSVLITGAATTTSVSSNNNPSFTAAPNNSVTFTATVTSNSTVNEGTVTFKDGANSLVCSGGNPVAVSNGSATCTTTFTVEGSHAISANYSGTVNFVASSGNLTQVANNHTVQTGNQFCNPGAITIPGTAGAALPYPSNIFVTGVGGTISKVTVALNNISSSNIPQTDLLLVGPTGAALVPFASVGDGSSINAVNIVLDDAAGSQLPGGSPFTSGTFKPTSITGSTSLVFPAPAPAITVANYAPSDGTASLFTKFEGTAPNGTWALYAMDNSGNGAASIGGGWCVNITAGVAPAITSANNTTFVEGIAGSFNVTTTGSPTPSLTQAGALPGGVTFVDNHNGTGTLSGTPTANGVFPITFSASNGTTVTQSFTLTVGKTPTSTHVTSNLNPSTFGQSVTFTATVTSSGGTPVGSVTFVTGSTTLGTVKLSKGVAMLSTSALNASSHTVTAKYMGSPQFIPSNGSVVQMVQKISTTTTITNASPSPSTYGQAVTFTATVTAAAGAPTGTVRFKDGLTVLGTGAVSGGTATFTTTATQLSGGSNSITAAYGGDSDDLASTSTAFSQTVNKAATTTLLNSSPNPATVGQTVTLTTTVSSGSGTVTGMVSFHDGATQLGTGTLSSGVAQITATFATTGTHHLGANYLGNKNFATSTGSHSETVH